MPADFFKGVLDYPSRAASFFNGVARESIGLTVFGNAIEFRYGWALRFHRRLQEEDIS
jgi:hypothetical protein